MLKKASNLLSVNKNLFFVIIFVLLTLFRLLWLDRFPVGMSHDEIEYSVNGLSYRYSGKDLSGIRFPLSIFRTRTEGRISIIPALIISVYSIFTNVNELSLRLLYWSIGIISSIVFYKIVGLLFDKKIARYSLIVFLINPWTFDLFRWVNDTNWALLFILLGIYYFLLSLKKSIYISLLFFILAFLSYHAVKIIFIPLLLVLFVYKYFILRDRGKKYLGFLIFGLIFFLFYLALEYKLPGEPVSGRLNDIVFLNTENLSKITNLERRMTIDSVFKNIFSNKLTTAYNVIIRKYFTAFAPDTLLFSGDVRSTYTFGGHGLFYLLDIFILIFGIFKAFKIYKKQLLLIALLILISPLATSVSEVEASVFNRSFLLIPTFIILIGIGISGIVNIKNDFAKYFILVIYTISLINFTNFYFLYFPIAQQENHYYSEKLLSVYLNKINDRKVTVFTAENRSLGLNYVFYLKDKRVDAISHFADSYRLNPNSITIGNITFSNDCELGSGSEINIYHRNMNCAGKDTKNAVVIQDQKDSGGIFYIQNDNLCKNVQLTTYRRIHKIEDYDVTGMGNIMFCERWINKI